jgi:T5SS/PEP-CTERM-associated repeat protein
MSRVLDRRFRILCKVTFTVAILSFAALADAVPRFWSGPGGPVPWSIPVFWSPPGIPEAGDDVFITPTDNTARQIIYDYVGPPITLNSLTLDMSGGPGGAGTVPLLFTMAANDLSATTVTVGNSGVSPHGAAVFFHTGGVNTIGSGGLSLAVNSDDLGIYDLSGGTMTSGGNVYVGGSSSGAGGTGILNIAAGTFTTSGTLVVYNTGDAFNGPSTINLMGGTIDAGGLNFNGMPSHLNWTAGTLNITNSVTFDSAAAGTTTSAAFGPALTLGTGQTLEITGNETLGGTGAFALTVNSGGTNTVTGDLNVNSLGNLTVNSGGLVTTPNLRISNGPGPTAHVVVTGTNAAVQAGGVGVGVDGHGDLTVTAGGSVSSATAFQVGPYGNSIGELTVSGADSIVTAGWYTWVGWFGEGTLTVDSGGTILMPTGDLSLAVEPGSQGTVNINNGGTITANSGVYVGGNWASPSGGTGVLNVNSGGTLTTNNQLEVRPSSAANKVNLAGGTINVASLNFHGTPSLLNWTSGTLNITNNVTFDSMADGTTTGAVFGASRTLGTGQTLKITGSETLGDTGTFDLAVNGGGTNLVTGDLVVNHTGTLTVNSGGTVSVQSTAWVGEHATLPTIVTVSGSGATMQTDIAMVIGTTGRGNLLVENEGVVTNGGPFVLGDSATGIGMASVGGADAKIQPSQFQIGRFGQGTLTINSGGLAQPNGSSPSFFLGTESGGDGTLVINSGGTAASSSSVNAGYGAGGSGQISVAGQLQADLVVRIGRFGTGTMDVNASGIVTSPQLLIGTQAGGAGTVNVDGGTVTSSLAVGVAVATPSNGAMHISNGGTVTAGQFVIASAVDSTGNSTIDGATTSVTVQGVVGTQPLNLAVGQRGNGTLAMTNGATAIAPVVSIGQYPGATGQATIGSGALLHATSYFGVGTAFNPFSIPPVDVGADGGNGTLVVNGSGAAKTDLMLLTGNNSTVDLTGGGTMTVGDVGMMVPSAGSVLVGAGGTVKGTGTIKGAVVNDGGMVLPGFSPGTLHINGDYTQSTGGTLVIDLESASIYDLLDATGSMTLGGTLQVNALGMYSPALGATFDILNFTTATPFTTVNLPPLGVSLAWNTSLLYTTGVISVVAGGLPGDLNNDGKVDAADYVLWRKYDMSPAGYTAWRSNFGQPFGSGSAAMAHAAAPEPDMFVMLLVGLLMAGYRRSQLSKQGPFRWR